MARVEIVPYDARWPGEFSDIGRTLRRALGHEAQRIDHIGSTSVPDLSAKDVIDVQVTVESLPRADRPVAALMQEGYLPKAGIVSDHVPPGGDPAPEQWAKRFFRGPVGSRATHVHVRGAGCANQRYALLFRDYLLAEARAAAGYEEVKRMLARHHADDIAAYYDIKDPVCDVIIAAAERWAAACEWAPGPSGA